MSKQLLVDYLPFEVTIEQINESLKVNSGRLVVHGVLQRSDIKNQNGRVYPHAILQKEVKNFNTKYVNEERALGEPGHPMGPVINLDRVSHVIKELKEDGKNFIGKAKVMDTPNGKIVKSFINEGVKLGVSSRGMGSLKMNKQGVNEVQSDFVLSTIAFLIIVPLISTKPSLPHLHSFSVVTLLQILQKYGSEKNIGSIPISVKLLKIF